MTHASFVVDRCRLFGGFRHIVIVFDVLPLAFIRRPVGEMEFLSHRFLPSLMSPGSVPRNERTASPSVSAMTILPSEKANDTKMAPYLSVTHEEYAFDVTGALMTHGVMATVASWIGVAGFSSLATSAEVQGCSTTPNRY